MTDIQKRAFKAGYDGEVLSQFLIGVKDKEKEVARTWFLKGMIQRKKEPKK